MSARKPAVYPRPSYTDPKDRRAASIITQRSEAQDGSVNLLGVPFDKATLGRKGSAAAPAAIREALRYNSNFNPETGDRLLDIRLNDLGDLMVQAGTIEGTHAIIQDEVINDVRSTALLVLLGGDNSISLPAIKACSQRFGNIGLIVIDSHYDMRGRIGGHPTSGSSYGLALNELGKRVSGRLVEIGVHGFLNSFSYHRKAVQSGVTLFTAKDVLQEGASRVAREAYKIASAGAECVYLSIDMDAIGIAEVSGVSAPSPGGLSSRDVFDIVYYVASRKLTKCVDIVETSPPLDPTGRSQLLAATMLLYISAGFGVRRFLHA